MKLKMLAVLLLTGLVGGCTATITPRGDVYAEALLPSTVVVEEYASPVVVTTRPAAPLISWYRPYKPHARHHAPAYRPSAPRPHGNVTPGHRPGGHKPQGAVPPGNGHKPGGQNRPGGRPQGSHPQKPGHH